MFSIKMPTFVIRDRPTATLSPPPTYMIRPSAANALKNLKEVSEQVRHAIPIFLHVWKCNVVKLDGTHADWCVNTNNDVQQLCDVR